MIKIISVGKVKEKAMISLIEEYRKRLSAFTKVELIEVKDEHVPSNNSEAEDEIAKKKEGERVLTKIKDSDVVIAMDLHGKSMDSESFAKLIQDQQTYQSSTVVFVIAGSLGYSKELISRANVKVKLSDFTFPHQIVKLLLIEQIYRAFMIRNNQTYHK